VKFLVEFLGYKVKLIEIPLFIQYQSCNNDKEEKNYKMIELLIKNGIKPKESFFIYLNQLSENSRKKIIEILENNGIIIFE